MFITAIKAISTVLTLGMNLAARESNDTIASDAKLIESTPEGESRAYVKSRLEANGSSRRAKRFLATMTGAVWAFAWILPILLELITGRVLQSVEALQIAVAAPFAMVMTYYFVKDGAGNAVSALMGIFAQKMKPKRENDNV